MNLVVIKRSTLIHSNDGYELDQEEMGYIEGEIL